MRIVLPLFVALSAATSAYADSDPYEVKLTHPICVETAIAEITARLGSEQNGKIVSEDPKKVGSAVRYANGVLGVSYDYVAALSKYARVGDKVGLCLVAHYVHCPKGDDRGKTYRATDHRTGKSWELGDSEHICGGA